MRRCMGNLNCSFRARAAYLFSKSSRRLPRLQYVACCSGGANFRKTGCRGMFARMPTFKLIGKLEETYPTDHGGADECSPEEKPKASIRHDGNPFQLVIALSLNATNAALTPLRGNLFVSVSSLTKKNI